MPYDGKLTDWLAPTQPAPDLARVTAENFARWAEARETISLSPEQVNPEYLCAVVQFLRENGFPHALASCDFWVERAADERSGKMHQAAWLQPVTAAFDSGERSGPRLAAIARAHA